MTWKATDPMKERTKLVLEWERRWHEAEGGAVNMAQRCRKAWPTCGPRKLRTPLVEANPGQVVPSASVMSTVLKRRGLTTPRRRRRRAPALGVVAPCSGCDAANAVWCIDFKGWFETRDGVRCYPLTLLDAFGRFLLRCEALVEPDGAQVRRILDSAFLEFGLSHAIRSDGGPPFASTGPARLHERSVWLLRLGINVEIIAPGKPQQNGRLERLHRTRKAEVAASPEANRRAQQRAFALWQRAYNHERPHEALGQRRPASVYTPSSRRYPRPRVALTADPCSDVARVDKHGFVKWRQRRLFISSARKHEYVEFDPMMDGRWDVRWGGIPLGRFHEQRLDRGLVVARRPRGAQKVSGMSVV